MTIEQRAIKEYGTTDSAYEAGYILPDGRMLDFSEKNNGGRGGCRPLDHRDVSQYYPALGQTDAMNQFLKDTKCIRMSADKTSLSIDICTDSPATEEQKQRIINIVLSRRRSVYIDFYAAAFDETPAAWFADDYPSKIKLQEVLATIAEVIA